MLEDEQGEVVIAAIRTYGDTIHAWWSGGTTGASSCPASGRSTPRFQPAAGRPQVRRPLRRQRRAGQDERVGASSTSDVMGFKNLHLASTTRTSPPSTPSLMSKVMANGNERIKFPINEPAAGQEEVADRRVPRFLSRPGRAARRDRHRRHRRARSTALRHRGRRVPPRAVHATTTTLLDAGRQDRRGPGARSGSSASWSTATTRATCCRSSPSRSGSPDAVLRDHPAEGRQELRQGQLQGAVRGDRAGAGARGNL